MAEHCRCRLVGPQCRDVGEVCSVPGQPSLDERVAERVQIVEVVVDELAAHPGLGGRSRHGDATEPGAVEESTDGLEELPAAIRSAQVGALRHGWRHNVDMLYSLLTQVVNGLPTDR